MANVATNAKPTARTQPANSLPFPSRFSQPVDEPIATSNLTDDPPHRAAGPGAERHPGGSRSLASTLVLVETHRAVQRWASVNAGSTKLVVARYRRCYVAPGERTETVVVRPTVPTACALRRRLRLLAAVMFGVVICPGCGGGHSRSASPSTTATTTAPSASSAGTTPYVLTASDAGFMATFPAKPQRLQRSVGSLTLILYLATGPNETEENVGVTYIPVPASTGFSLDGGIASAAGDLEGRVVSHSRLTYEGQPAEDGVITFSNGTAQVRVVEFGSSGYVLEGSGPSASTFARDYDILLSTFRHSSAPTPGPTGSTTTQTPQTSLTTPGSGNGSLGSEMIPAPAGFELAQGFGVGNGPMNAADFDSFVGTKGLATTLHFVSGFSATYNSIQSNDSAEVTLFRFATSQDATDFLIRILSGQTSRPDPGISGGAEYDSTAADNNGFYHHGVLATKGAVFMAVDYGNGNASRPTLVDTMARQQYANL